MHRRNLARYLLIAALPFLGAAAQAQGQGVGAGLSDKTLPPAATPAPPMPYSGPGDVVSGAFAAYSLRAYSLAVALTGTQKAVNIRRTSDSAATDLLILTTGDLDIATGSSFCAATTCFIAKWYDQSGNGRDASQPTAANQPQLLFSGGPSTNKPYIAFVLASNQRLSSGVISAIAQPFSISAVAIRTGSFTTTQMLVAINGTTLNMSFRSAANSAQIAFSTSLNATASDSAWHALLGVVNGATSILSVDGAETAGNAGANSTGTTINIGESSSGASPLSGRMAEAIIWASGISASQRAALVANQQAYWGTP